MKKTVLLVVLCMSLLELCFADFFLDLKVDRSDLFNLRTDINYSCIDKVYPKESFLAFFLKQSDPFKIVLLKSVPIFDFKHDGANFSDMEKNLLKVFRGILHPVRCIPLGEDPQKFDEQTFLESIFGKNYQILKFGMISSDFLFKLD